MKTRYSAASAIAALAVAGCLLSGCGLHPQMAGGFGSGGSASPPDPNAGETSFPVAMPFHGSATPSANDRNFGAPVN